MKQPFVAGEYVALLEQSEGPIPLIAARDGFHAKSLALRGRYIVRRLDYAKVEMRYNPLNGSYYVNDIVSPVIQFSVWPMQADEITQGRLCYVSSYVTEAGLKVDKDDDFVRWARRAFRSVSKSLRREQDYYVGPDAFDLRQKSKARLVVRYPGTIHEFTPNSVVVHRTQ